MIVPAPAGRNRRIDPLEFVQHTRREAVIHNVVGVSADDGRPLHAIGARPTLESEYLLAEL